MNRRTLILGAGALLSSTALVPFAALAQAAAPAAPAAGEGAAPQITEMTLGSADAPVEVVEYASLTCPHCARFATEVFPKLKAEYIDTGKVRFVYRDVYFDRFGLWASMIARCGGEQRFFGIVDVMYEKQKDWLAGGSDPAAIAENLRTIGKTAGLDDATLEACMTDGDTAKALVEWYQANAEQDGINSTPSFLIDGQKYDNMAWDKFKALLDEKLAG